MNMEFTKPMIKDLIDMYRNRKCLWEVKSDDYKKKKLRMKAYQEIATYFKSKGITDATDTLVRNRIQNMRRSVRKEKTKIEASKGTYKTHLWYYDMLEFAIGKNDTPSRSCDERVIKIEPEDSDTDNSNFLVSVKDPLDDKNFQPINLSQEKVTETFSKSKTFTVNTAPESTAKYIESPDEFEALGISIAAKFRRMDSGQQIHAELLIQKVLAKGLLGQLNDQIDIVDFTNARIEHGNLHVSSPW